MPPQLPPYLQEAFRQPEAVPQDQIVAAQQNLDHARQYREDTQAQTAQKNADAEGRINLLEGVMQRMQPSARLPTGVTTEASQPNVEEFARKYGPAAAAEYQKYLNNPAYKSAPGLDPDVGKTVPENNVTRSFQEGGLVGPGGQNATMAKAGLAMPTGGAGQPAGADVLNKHIDQMMTQNPQVQQQIQQAIQQAMQTGELTPQELNTMVQLAKTAAQNPQMYPRIRQFAIQQGLATEQDLPPQYDEGLVAVILMAAKAAQAGAPAQGAQPQSATQAPVASMASGGALPAKSGNADGSINIDAHEGEYVIPKHIVAQKGTDFFDKLIGKDPKSLGQTKA
jgi:hypothetical protein